MNNLKRFNTESEYQQASLNYPAVSWVVSGDSIHYDKTSGSPTPTPTNYEVKMVSYDGSGDDYFTFFNCEASSSGDIVSITLDDVPVSPITCQSDSISASENHYATITISSTTIGDWLSGDLGLATASEHPKLDVLLPSQTTYVEHFPNNMNDVVILATTPPDGNLDLSSWEDGGVYVPNESVNDYKSSSLWGTISGHIYPLSDYSGPIIID